MKPEHDTGPQANELLTRLNTVTPFSKYLAMTLFVALPFLGGWIGYVFSTVKVGVVERVIEIEPKETAQQEVVPEDDMEQLVRSMSYRYDASNQVIRFSDLIIGEEYGQFTLEDIIVSEPYGTLQAVFTGETTIVGNIKYDNGMMIGEIFIPTIGSLQKLPLILRPNEPTYYKKPQAQAGHHDSRIGCVFFGGGIRDRSLYFTESNRLYQLYVNEELYPHSNSKLTDLVAITVSGLKIFDPENSNWCIEAIVTDFGFFE